MQFTFFREETGKTEDVKLEDWYWKVRYNDGSELSQFDFNTGKFHQFKEIDTEQPFIFQVVKSDGSQEPITILYNPDTMKLFYFYRNGILDNFTRRIRLIVFGYKAGKHTHHFVTMPSGEIVITDNIDLIHF